MKQPIQEKRNGALFLRLNVCLLYTSIISREFIISGFRLVASDNGVVIAASYWGKFKTTFQMIAVVLLIFNIPALHTVTRICLWIALILTIVSLIDYLMKNHKVLTEGSI